MLKNILAFIFLMRLFLTRHGETVENRDSILQGWLPGHLTTKGKKQARLVAKRLKDVKFDYIYTSDLKRCVDTSKIIAKYHKNSKFVKEKALRERNFGRIQGMRHSDIDWNSNFETDTSRSPPNGESYEKMFSRIKSFYKKLLKKHSKDSILIVGHGGSIMLLNGLVNDYSLKKSISWGEGLKNTAISEYQIDKNGKAKPVCLNCTKHL